MKNNHFINAVLAGSLSVAASSAQAVMLQPGDLLTIGSGSWFAMDMDLNGQIAIEEQAQIYPGSSGGIIIGGDNVVTPQVISEIDTWSLFGHEGHHFTTIAPTGSTEAGLDFRGWSIFHNGTYLDVAIDYGAWTPSNCGALGCGSVSFVADVATIYWGGIYGDSYSLWYSWVFLDSAPGAMMPVYYLLHLEGVVVSSVPLPPALWLFGLGLVGLLGAIRYRR